MPRVVYALFTRYFAFVNVCRCCEVQRQPGQHPARTYRGFLRINMSNPRFTGDVASCKSYLCPNPSTGDKFMHLRVGGGRLGHGPPSLVPAVYVVRKSIAPECIRRISEEQSDWYFLCLPFWPSRIPAIPHESHKVVMVSKLIPLNTLVALITVPPPTTEAKFGAKKNNYMALRLRFQAIRNLDLGGFSLLQILCPGHMPRLGHISARGIGFIRIAPLLVWPYKFLEAGTSASIGVTSPDLVLLDMVTLAIQQGLAPLLCP
ncbi:hypothetical protein BJV78DRAFT_1329415 [Lactifluus subvellereus]|nr:hypothetical protein BJV78DRAFT_1329415 [Lactifluus subvellereus]